MYAEPLWLQQSACTALHHCHASSLVLHPSSMHYPAEYVVCLRGRARGFMAIPGHILLHLDCWCLLPVSSGVDLGAKPYGCNHCDTSNGSLGCTSLSYGLLRYYCQRPYCESVCAPLSHTVSLKQCLADPLLTHCLTLPHSAPLCLTLSLSHCLAYCIENLL